MLAGATNPTLTFLSAQLTNAGDYFVTVSNSLGSATSRAARLTVAVGLTVTTNGYGKVAVTPALGAYDPGSRVELRAVPEAGRKFLGWSGDATGKENPLVVTLDRSLQVVAEFSHLPGDLLWSFDADGYVRCPAIGPDGTLYLGGSKVFALDGLTGEKKWEHAAAAAYTVVGPDGTIIVAAPQTNVSNTTSATLFALDGATGQKKWEASRSASGWWAATWPAVGGAGLVYWTAAGSIYALDTVTGAERWALKVGNYVGSPALGEDDAIYVLCNNYTGICALDGRTGQRRWSIGLSESAQSDPVVGENNIVYVSGLTLVGGPRGVGYPYLRAVDAKTGYRKWTTPQAFSSMSIGGGGILFVVMGGLLGNPYSDFPELTLGALIPTNGAIMWQLPWSYLASICPPAVAEDGTVYLARNHPLSLWIHGGKLEAFEGASGRTKWSFGLADPTSGTSSSTSFSEPALGPDGTVYVGCANGMLYALKGSGSGLADSPWPKARANPRNTGQAFTVFPKLSGPTGGGLYLEGSPVELRTDATGPSPISLQWRFNGQSIPGATNASWKIASVFRNDAGTYSVVASNAYATVISRPVVVSVHNVVPSRWPLVRFTAPPGTPLQVQYAERLGSPPAWHPLADVTLPASPDGFVDSTASAITQRFYRTTQTDRLGIQIVPGWTFEAPIGSVHRVEYVDEATGLANWQFLTDLTLPSSPYLFVDLTATNAPPRQYRTTPLP